MADPAFSRADCTLADVAQAAGVSVSTVSLALRNSQRISQQTRDLVHMHARALKYRPDPKLGKLMTHLRARKSREVVGCLCGLVFESDPSPHVLRFTRAATAAAESLGYKLEIVQVPCDQEKRAQQERLLEFRGVDGLLFLPSRLPLRVPTLYHWERFSVVAAGACPIEPDMDRVLVNWFNAVRVCHSQLRQRGYGRPGYVLGAHLDHLFKYLLTSAVAEQHTLAQCEPVEPLFYLPQLPEGLQPLICPSYLELVEGRRQHPLSGKLLAPFPQGLVEWYRRATPDVLVFDCEDTATSGQELLRNATGKSIPCVVLSCSSESEFAGICPQLEAVAEAAVMLLNTKILNGKRGLPRLPFEQLYRGEWKDGPSLPAG